MAGVILRTSTLTPDPGAELSCAGVIGEGERRDKVDEDDVLLPDVRKGNGVLGGASVAGESLA